MGGMKKTQIYIPQQMLSELDELSKAKGISRAEIIRAAVEFYLKKNK